MHPAKTQISLSIAQYNQSSLSAWRSLRSLAIIRTHNKVSDQTGHPIPPRLIWVFTGRTGDFVGFVMLRLKYNWRHPCFRTLTFRIKQTIIAFKAISVNMPVNCHNDGFACFILFFIKILFFAFVVIRYQFGITTLMVMVNGMMRSATVQSPFSTIFFFFFITFFRQQ